MIKVVIVSDNAENEIELLASQTDIKVTQIMPTTMEEIGQQIANNPPDIIVIEQDLDTVSADILCHFLSQQCPQARSLILVEEQPQFEMLQNFGFKAHGFITAEQRPLLAKAIRAIHDGEMWIPRNLVGDMLN